jgi:hypothetical protein
MTIAAFRKTTALPLALMAGLAAACIAPTQRREEVLIREARTFNDDLRWARFDQLSLALPPEEARLFLARVRAVGDDLVLADYEVTAINFGKDSESATVSAKFEWYSRRAAIVHSTTLEQRWELRGGRWLVMKQRRVQGDRFPLVPEPLTPSVPDGGPPR